MSDGGRRRLWRDEVGAASPAGAKKFHARRSLHEKYL